MISDCLFIDPLLIIPAPPEWSLNVTPFVRPPSLNCGIWTLGTFGISNVSFLSLNPSMLAKIEIRVSGWFEKYINHLSMFSDNYIIPFSMKASISILLSATKFTRKIKELVDQNLNIIKWLLIINRHLQYSLLCSSVPSPCHLFCLWRRNLILFLFRHLILV